MQPLKHRILDGFKPRQVTPVGFLRSLSRTIAHSFNQITFIILYVGINAFLFTWNFMHFYEVPSSATMYSILGLHLPIAKGSALVINFNCALILLSVCRKTCSVLRKTWLNYLVPFDENLVIHQVSGYCVVLFSAIHTIAHLFNVRNYVPFVQYTTLEIAYLSGVGVTGVACWVALYFILTASFKQVRVVNFEIFWFSHHMFVGFFVFLVLHGGYCFVKSDIGEECPPSTFWKFAIGPGALYVLERLVRIIRSFRSTKMVAALAHPSRVLELNIIAPWLRAKSGKYIFICVPIISPFEWHPFTLSSAPYEGILKLHIREAGNWTRRLSSTIGLKFEKEDFVVQSTSINLPKVMIDGPFGTSSEDAFKYEVSICIGAGIGQTPCASLMKQIWYEYQTRRNIMKLKKVYFILIMKTVEAFEWFLDIIRKIEEQDHEQFIEIFQYLTAKLDQGQIENIYMNTDRVDAITGLKTITYYGRPDFDSIFSTLANHHVKRKIGVFFCGPDQIAKTLRECSRRHSTNGTRFDFHMEHF